MSKASSRTEKSLLNVLTGVFGQCLSFVLSFVIRTVFIKTLGELYLGLNGLYSNILSVLNLTELGLGTAIVVELYRTVAQNDEEKSKQYIQLYKKAYLIIGSIILIAGITITPFLQYFVNDSESLELVNYRLVFLLYLINTVFPYFFFEYRQSILQANQEEYKTRLISYGFKFAEMTLQIVFLLAFKNIYVYLIIPIVLNCVSTIIKGTLAGRWYPFIKEAPKNKLSEEERKTTWKNVGSVATYKISGCIINSTDSIVLSSFVSIIITGIYSNYLVITSAVVTVLDKVFSAFTASLGNLNVNEKDNTEKKYQVFCSLNFLNFWTYGICAVLMYTLFEPFITVWVGERFVLDKYTEMIIILNFLVVGLQTTIGIHRCAYGLFYKGRFRPVFSIILNIVISIVLVQVFPQKYGIVAVLLGTILSHFFAAWWYDAWLVYRYAFCRSPREYYTTYCVRLLYCIVVCLGTKYICNQIDFTPVICLPIYAIIAVLIFNVSFYLFFRKKSEFGDLLVYAKQILKKITKGN